MSVAGVADVVLRDGTAMPQLGTGVFQVPPERAGETVAHALAAGYRLIDTATAYRNEREVGKAIRASGLHRGEVFVTTKCSNSDHGYEEATEALGRSLESLELGPIDLYLVHWPVPTRDRYVETWQALIDLQAAGLVRSIGVCNFQPAHLERLIAETGVVPVVNQIELHPRLQQHELRRLHAELGIVTESWSSLGRGTLIDDPVIGAIARRHARTPAQVLIRWNVQLRSIVLTRSVTPARLRENIDVLDFELDDADMAAIGELDAGERVGPDPETFVAPPHPH